MAASNLVQALSRGLDLVELLAGSPEGLALKEAVALSGLKTTTAHNLLGTLVAKRFAAKSTRPTRYRLGEAALGLVKTHSNRSMLRRAEAVVRKLFKETAQATVVLCEAVGDGNVAGEVVAALRISPERPRLVERPRGKIMHPYGSASALVFQAYWAEEERAAFRRRHPFWEFGAHLWKTEDRLDRFLARVRRAGYAAADIKGHPLKAVAAPVFAPTGELVASIGASVPAPVRVPSGRPELDGRRAKVTNERRWARCVKLVVGAAEEVSAECVLQGGSARPAPPRQHDRRATPSAKPPYRGADT